MMLNNKANIKPVLVAHRGYSRRYPENTLLAMRQAFSCGACYVECDVQLTRDRIPVLMHDRDLSRAAGVTVKVHELNYAELKKLSISFSEKFADEFKDEKITTLEEFVELLSQWPDRAAFIELKRSSINEFGVGVMLEKVLAMLNKVKERVAVISFNEEIIRQLIAMGGWKTGWIIDEWSDENYRKLAEMSPSYCFVDYECLPPRFENFQDSSWNWILYEIDDPELADEYIQKGVSFIETNDICMMLQSNKLSSSGCA